MDMAEPNRTHVPEPTVGGSADAVAAMMMADPNSPRQPQTGPRPDEIAALRFSWKFFGAHPGEVRRALSEVAAALDRTRAALAQQILENRTLERSLQSASTTIQDLRQELLATKSELSASRDRERALERELLAAEGSETTTRPDEIMEFAQQTASAIILTARTVSLEVLRSARRAARAVRQSVDTCG